MSSLKKMCVVLGLMSSLAAFAERESGGSHSEEVAVQIDLAGSPELTGQVLRVFSEAVNQDKARMYIRKQDQKQGVNYACIELDQPKDAKNFAAKLNELSLKGSANINVEIVGSCDQTLSPNPRN